MEAVEIHCPNCEARIPAADINITALVAKCGQCDRVFRLPEAVVGEDGSVPDEPLACPSGIVVEADFGDRLVIRRSWFTPALFFLLFFCIAWDGFLVFWYSMALFGNPANGNAGFEWLAILFPICHVAVGVGLTYSVIAGFLNRTWITVDRELLRIRHAPVPWRGNRSLSVEDIKALESEYTHNSNGNGQLALCVHHEDGRQVTLLTGLDERHTRYIGTEVARFLNVPFRRNESPGRASAPWWARSE